MKDFVFTCYSALKERHFLNSNHFILNIPADRIKALGKYLIETIKPINADPNCHMYCRLNANDKQDKTKYCDDTNRERLIFSIKTISGKE